MFITNESKEQDVGMLKPLYYSTKIYQFFIYIYILYISFTSFFLTSILKTQFMYTIMSQSCANLSINYIDRRLNYYSLDIRIYLRFRLWHFGNLLVWQSYPLWIRGITSTLYNISTLKNVCIFSKGMKIILQLQLTL